MQNETSLLTFAFGVTILSCISQFSKQPKTAQANLDLCILLHIVVFKKNTYAIQYFHEVLVRS